MSRLPWKIAKRDHKYKGAPWYRSFGPKYEPITEESNRALSAEMDALQFPVSLFDEACANCGQGKSKHTQIQTMAVNTANFMTPLDLPPLRYCPQPVEKKS